MSPPTDGADDESPAGWATEESSGDVRSWLGAEDRVVCVREGGDEDDGWIAYTEPRGELGASHQVPLTDGSTTRDEALSAARDYMERNAEE